MVFRYFVIDAENEWWLIEVMIFHILTMQEMSGDCLKWWYFISWRPIDWGWSIRWFSALCRRRSYVSICVSNTSSACFFRVSEGSGAWRKFVRLILALFLLIFNLKSLKICLWSFLNSFKTQKLIMPIPQRSGMHAARHAHIHKSSSNAHVRLHYRIIQWIIYWTVAPQRIRIRTTWMRHHSYHSIDLSA